MEGLTHTQSIAQSVELAEDCLKMQTSLICLITTKAKLGGWGVRGSMQGPIPLYHDKGV